MSNEEIKFDAHNYRTHDEKNLKLIKKSLKELGAGRSIVIDSEGEIIAGNATYKQAQELGLPVQVVETDGKRLIVVKRTDLKTQDKKRKKLALADNSTSDKVQWDFDHIAADFDLEELPDWGIEDLPNTSPVQAIEEDDAPEVSETTPRAKKGDIWQLGDHRLMCGDSTVVTDVEKLMNGEKADMVFTDPPYGMKKEKDGVLNDNLNYDDLLEFNKKWIPVTLSILKDMGSWYCWGIDEPLMDIYSHILKPLKKENKIVIRNYITWAKHAAFGINSKLALSYPKETEKAWFVVKGQDWNNNNADFFNTKYEKILLYMQEQAKKVNITAKDIQKVCGVQMYSHWFTRSQFTIIPEKHYLKLKQTYKGAFEKEYNDILGLVGEDNNKNIKPYFDPIAAEKVGDIGLTDVWRFPITSQKERENAGNHATPKPISLCSRAIKASSRENEKVLDVFGGSGSTLIACEQLNRKCYMMELDPHFCDVIITRWETLTGKQARLLEA